MFRFFLIFFLICFLCAAERSTPYAERVISFEKVWQVKTKEIKFTNSQLMTAIIIFYYYWEKEFGDPNKDAFKSINQLTIKWGTEMQTVKDIYDINGMHLSESKIVGRLNSKNEIWLYYRDRLSKTSLVHELVHVSLFAANKNHGDPDHEGTMFFGWTKEHSEFIKKVNYVLGKLGL